MPHAPAPLAAPERPPTALAASERSPVLAQQGFPQCSQSSYLQQSAPDALGGTRRRTATGAT